MDLDKGVYVEMEVRFSSSKDVDYKDMSENFLSGHRVREIPDDFCHKNKEITQQAYFCCLVYNCNMKSLRPLRDHVTYNKKHVRKACDKKRQILGLLMEPLLRGQAGQQEKLTYKEEELELPIERLVAKLYKRETFGAGEEVVVEVIIEEEGYGFMVTNFWVNGRLWRGDQTTSEIRNSNL